MRRRDLSKVLFASAAGTAMLAASSRSQAQVCSAPCYPITPDEAAAGIAPINTAYPPMNVRRYGASDAGGYSDNAFMNAAFIAQKMGGNVYVPESFGYFVLGWGCTLANGVGAVIDGKIRLASTSANGFVAGNDCVITGTGIIEGSGAFGGSLQSSNGVYANGKRNVTVSGLRFKKCERAIQLTSCKDYKILDNHISEGTYDAANTLQYDIVVYSSASGQRGIISRNHCLSNNDIGIYVNPNGFDTDTIISDNVCVATEAGAPVDTLANNRRRHGIMLGYSGGASGRIICTGNICSFTRLTGIYRNASPAFPPALSHVVTDNFCSTNGLDSSNPLAGGILFAHVAPGDLIANNAIDDFRGNLQSTNGAIVVNRGEGAMIRGNNISNCAGNGVVVRDRAARIVISDNLFTNVTLENLILVTEIADNVGGHDVLNNRFSCKTLTASAIFVDTRQTTLPIRIAGNRFAGTGNSTEHAGNSAISFQSMSAPLEVTDNQVQGFYYGIYAYSQSPGINNRDVGKFRLDRNTFRNCNTAVAFPYAPVTASIVICGNAFIDVNTPAVGCFVGERVGLRFMLTNVNAAPAGGTWIAGDCARFTAPGAGAAPGANCVADGSPGVWKNWPALSS